MPQSRREAGYFMPNTRRHLTHQPVSEPDFFCNIPQRCRARCSSNPSSNSSRSKITPFYDPLIQFKQPTEPPEGAPLPVLSSNLNSSSCVP
eukprot:4798450-Prymnesium_polylepis.1